MTKYTPPRIRVCDSVAVAALSALAAALALPSPADTVAWWHFDEKAPGTTAANNTISDEMHPAVFGAPYVYIGTSAKAAGTADYASSDVRQRYSRPLGALSVYDPVSGATRANRSALRFAVARGGDNASDNAGRAYYGGTVKVNTADDFYAACANAITVECFVRIDSGEFNTFAPIVGSLGPSKWTAEKWAIYMETDGTIAARFNGTVVYSGNSGERGSAKINDGLWHHVALTWDGATYKLFVDYKQDTFASSGNPRQKALTGTVSYTSDGANATYIGGYGYSNTSGARRFPGSIDELRVSSAALEPSQFLRLVDPAVDEDTALHLSFDTPDSGALEAGDILGGAVGGVQAVYTPMTGAEAASLDASEKAGATIGTNVFDDSPFANVSSFYQETNAVGVANYVKTANFTGTLYAEGQSGITNVTFTAEAFFKSRKDWQGGSTHTIFKIGTDYMPCWVRGGTSGYGLEFMARDYSKPTSTAAYSAETIRTSSATPVDDGNWHHVAFVSDAENQTVSAYLDYKLVGTSTGVYAPIKSAGYSIFVGSKENGGEYFDGWIDDVRVTRRALGPAEFLTTHPVGSGTRSILTAMLEQDYDFVCAANDNFSVTGTGAARTGGSAPVFEKVSRGALLLDGTNGTVSAANDWSAKMDRSSITFPASPFYERDAYTVEFWAKFDGFKIGANEEAGDTNLGGNNHAGILRLVRGGSTTFDWYFFRQSQNAKALQIAARQANGTIAYMSFPLDRLVADGKWHHYAVAFARNQDNTEATFSVYSDYELIGTETCSGLYDKAPGHRLMVCESTSPDYNILGNIDAIRFWQGNPDPSQFLGRANSPFMLIVR